MLKLLLVPKIPSYNREELAYVGVLLLLLLLLFLERDGGFWGGMIVNNS